MKKLFNILACFTLALSLGLGSVQVKAEDSLVNLALGAKATASGSEADAFGPSNAVDGIKDRVSNKTRWASSTGINKKWLKVDLGFEAKIEELNIEWERRNATDYSIEISNDDANWDVVFTGTEKPVDFNTKVVLDSGTTAQYIRLSVNDFDADSEGISWPTVSVFEFEVFGPKQLNASNLARGKDAQSSDNEDPIFSADKAFDGNKDRNSKSRWASNTAGGTKWLQVDLGKEETLQTIVIDWERRNATEYSILVSDNGTDWTSVYDADMASTVLSQRIVLENPVQARYIKLEIRKFNSTADGVTWNNVSVFELEAYSIVKEPSIEEVAEGIVMPTQTIDDAYLVLPEIEGYDINFYGADYNYVIDIDGKIHRPIVDTNATVNVTVSNGKKTVTSGDIVVTIPGENKKLVDGNSKPVVIPELREWYGTTGITSVTKDSKVILGLGTTAEDKVAVETFVEDYEDLFGVTLQIVENQTPKEGDILFTRVKDDGLGEEGYKITVDGVITVEANHYVGTVWSTKSLLQIFKLNDSTINNGIIRDYPRWEVRSFIFDVGRKTFTMDYLNDISKEMSWYKMNDFQVHLNDNYIFLEDYTASGEDPMTAYSGFRLESDIEGLQSEDVVYSKAEFKKFMMDSRANGVNIVPEIDVPAHSLQLTKARPDLKLGPVGRDADHLDLRNPGTLPFVKDIFNEYMTDENPVFDKDTIIHVGTDEYSTSYAKEFRQFTDDMISYVQDEKDRTVRIWGSLSYFKNDDTPVRSENVQMNIWNAGWSNPSDMFNEGFSLINSLDGSVYIVPDAGYYYDYLNTSHLYNNWTANNFAGTVLPAGSNRVLGGSFALWNDQIDKRNNGISEIDVYDRIHSAMPTMASKLWGEAKDLDYNTFEEVNKELGTAPNTNIEAKVESKTEVVLDLPLKTDDKDVSGNDYHVVKKHKSYTNGEALVLTGDSSLVELPLENISLGHSLQFSVKQDLDVSDTSEQILFEYQDTKIKMNQRSSAQYESSGKLGFSREGMDYEFDYTLPKGEWVNITITTKQHVSSLYVNGEKVDEIKRVRTAGNFYSSMNSSLLLPLQNIGSSTDSFKGLVKDVKVIAGEVANGEADNPVVVDKSILINMVEKYKDLRESDYTASSYKYFMDAMNQARSVIANDLATKEDVGDAWSNLVEAIEKLIHLDDVVDSEELESTIDTFKDIDLSLYTGASATAFKSVLDEAIALLKSGLASQAQIDDMLSKLQAAYKELVLEGDTDNTPTEPIEPVDPQNPDKDEQLPPTGIAASGTIFFSMLLMGAGLILFKRTKKSISIVK